MRMERFRDANWNANVLNTAGRGLRQLHLPATLEMMISYLPENPLIRVER
jgi:hypothetical protein